MAVTEYISYCHRASVETPQFTGLICHPSDLPNDISIGKVCGIQSGDVCEVICRTNSVELWKSHIRCRKNGRWEKTPSCPSQKTRSSSLELIRCNHLPSNIQEMSNCVRVTISISATSSRTRYHCPGVLESFLKFGQCTKISNDCLVRCGTSTMSLFCVEEGKIFSECILRKERKCPELKFAELINCSREQGTSCKIQCPGGKVVPEPAICLPTGEWTPLPPCYARFLCATELLPSEMVFTNATCKVSQNTTCKVGCRVYEYVPTRKSYSKKIAFVKEVHCGSSGRWENLPSCQKVESSLWDNRYSHCSEPKFDKNAVLQNDCLTKEGSLCLLKCKEGYGPEGFHALRCFKRKWLGKFHCILNKKCPNLPTNLIFECDCKRTPGSLCQVQCQRGILQGNNTIYCSKVSNWLHLPLCLSENHNNTMDCNPNIANPLIKFVENCTFKNEEKCQIKCIAKFVLVGLHFIICRKGQWRNIPRCFSQKHSPFKILNMQCKYPPPIPGNLKIIGTCGPGGGDSCDILCRDSSAKMIGPNATTCLPPGLWSRVESCVGGKVYCNQPILPKHLEFTMNCHGAEIDSKCSIRCKYRKQSKFVLTCQNSKRWNKFPYCTCPRPAIRHPVLLKEKCDHKRPGETCRLKCQSGYVLHQKKYITCLERLKWSSLPVCTKLFCPMPTLSESLKFHDDCTSKSSGDYCQLKCKEEGNTVGNGKIKCINGLNWSSLPKCTCAFPRITSNLLFKSNCSRIFPNSKCYLACKGFSTITGKPYLTCKSDMKWSVFPVCEKIICTKPNISSTLLTENCRSKSPGDQCIVECRFGGRLIGSNKITCLKSLSWSSFPKCVCFSPKLPFHLSFKENCSEKTSGESCLLSCKKPFFIESNHHILCKNDLEWSSYPTCKWKTCPKNVLPRALAFIGECSNIVSGKVCQVKCIGGGKMHGSKFIRCLKGISWTSLPKCSCPVPVFSEYMENVTDCNNVRVGESCQVKCKKSFYLIGESVITCQGNMRWTSISMCKAILCPIPKLPTFLISFDDCSSKLLGEKCRLQCREGSYFIGSNTLTCVKTRNVVHWTSFPSCTCPAPRLNNGLRTTGNCKSKKPGEICILICSKNLIIIGKNIIFCKNDTKWSELPKCHKQFCSVPKLPKHLLFLEDCSAKNVGDACLLECRSGGKNIQDNRIICLSFTVWTSVPNCSCPLPTFPKSLQPLEDCSLKQSGELCKVTCSEKRSKLSSKALLCGDDFRWKNFPTCRLRYCTKPFLPNYLIFAEECAFKIPGDTCKLVCKMGGKFIGESYIRCMQNLIWTSFPVCTCPSPKLKQGMHTVKNCTFKSQGEICSVKCHKNYKLEGKDSIICQQNNTWTGGPLCIIKTCPNPFLPKYLLLKENCSLKKVKEKCQLLCKHGGGLKGKDYIVCYSNMKWSKFPTCNCPLPLLNKNLTFREICFNKSEGEKCLLKCKMRQKDPEKVFIRCLKEGKWTILPSCSERVCNKPKLNNFTLFNDSCSTKLVNEICKLKCKTPLIFSGKDFIVCQSNYKWTPLPQCIEKLCPKLLLNKSFLNFNESCSRKLGSICKLKCAKNYTIHGSDFVTCLNDTKWSPIPKCKKILYCPEPNFDSSILRLKKSCSLKRSAESCEISCTEGGKLIGQERIICQSNQTWSTLPDCTCSKPNLSRNLILLESCIDKKKGEKCVLGCKSKYNLKGTPYLKCKNNTRWSLKAKCVAQCMKPKLPIYLVFKNNCSSKSLGESCILTCKENGEILGPTSIKCISPHKWSQFPDCACPPPHIPAYMEEKENCSVKKIGDNCEISCRGNARIEGKPMSCMNNTMWTKLPKCIPISCFKPELPIYLEFKENCTAKTVGGFCKVGCAQGGTILGNDTLLCLKETEWSKPPDCTCPKPILSKNLEINESCDTKKQDETCIIVCTKNSRLIGPETITCLENRKWSPVPKCIQTCVEPILPDHLSFQNHCYMKIIGESCEVTCRQKGKLLGNSTIKCLEGNKWSPFPNCTCPVPTLPIDLETKENCIFKKTGEMCEIDCKGNSRLIGSKSITCLNTTIWSLPPKCAMICSETSLPDYLAFKGNCSMKIIGDTCDVSCVHHGHILGNDSIMCLTTKTWSSFPDCTCPSPNLTGGVEKREDCSWKKRGDVCKIGCKRNSKIMGDDFLKCLETAEWSMLPKCDLIICSAPNMPDHLVFDGRCVSKLIGEFCRVRCKQKGKLLGNDSIECVSEHKWSEFPSCTCPIPALTTFMESEEICDSKQSGEQCKIGCVGKRKLIGNEFLTCLDNNTWTALPNCVLICDEPVLPDYLSISGTCSEKIINESCKVRCNQEGKIVGDENIKCLNENKWTSLPNCTCPIPILASDLETTDACENKKGGETCRIHCKGESRIIGKDYITCWDNGTWSPTPKCVSVCSQPTLPSHLAFNGSCSLKIVNETCEVKCNQNGTIVGESEIKCLDVTQWSSFPNCTCPIPILTADMAINETCSSKERGDICNIYCKGNSKIIGESFLTCQDNVKWSPLPKCAPLCFLPILPEYLKFTEDCSLKTINESCEVSCKGGGTLIGKSSIKCLSSQAWSTLPDCSCPPPIFNHPYLNETHRCLFKKRGEICHVKCKRNREIKGNKFIECLQNSTWSPLPKCACTIPSTMVFSFFKIDFFEKYYSSHACPAESCKESNPILEQALKTCTAEYDLSDKPHCACPSVFKKDIKYDEIICKVVCNISSKDLDISTCDINETILLLPYCREFCILPKQNPGVIYTCPRGIYALPNDTCYVNCTKNTRLLIGLPTISCRYIYGVAFWSEELHTCVPACSTAEIPANLFTDNCTSMVQVGIYCNLLCSITRKKPQPKSVVTCLRESQWSAMPTCT